MRSPFVKVVLFVLALVGIFIWISEELTRISGQTGDQAGGARAAQAGVSVERGEEIYWGKGKCHTCHSLGSRGSAIRGPNHENMGAKAAERAAERSRQTGKPMTAPDYIIESLLDPDAYLVAGYKNEMPVIYKPPISLKPDEIKSVAAYMLSLGGAVDLAAIKLPPGFEEAAKAAVVTAWKPYMDGDPEAGKALFFDADSPAACAKCHRVGGEGGTVGPELTGVAGRQPLEYIVDSILFPSKVIASGYEPVLVKTKDGRFLTGLLKRNDATGVTFVDKDGKTLTVPKAEIEVVDTRQPSLMPGNFAEVLTVKDLHDLLAFVLSLK